MKTSTSSPEYEREVRRLTVNYGQPASPEFSELHLEVVTQEVMLIEGLEKAITEVLHASTVKSFNITMSHKKMMEALRRDEGGD